MPGPYPIGWVQPVRNVLGTNRAAMCWAQTVRNVLGTTRSLCVGNNP